MREVMDARPSRVVSLPGKGDPFLVSVGNNGVGSHK